MTDGYSRYPSRSTPYGHGGRGFDPEDPDDGRGDYEYDQRKDEKIQRAHVGRDLLIRCVEAAIRSGQRVENDPGDYYANKDRAASAWHAVLDAFDRECDDPEARKAIYARLDLARYTGD